MQDYAALEVEILELRRGIPCPEVSVVWSSEAWNPVAAVVLHSVKLPPAIRPDTVDLRIPIPNLYGFAVSAGVALVPVPLREEFEGGTRPVPFCVATEYSIVGKQRPYYVDVRENHERVLASYALCVTPTDLPDRFSHVPLYGIVGDMLAYLEAPTKAVRGELSRYQAQLESKGPSAHVLMSIAHSYEGLGEYEAALGTLEYALTLFPGVEWVSRKAEYIRSLM